MVADVAVGAVGDAALSGRQVLLRAREDRTSEKAAFLYAVGRADGGDPGVLCSCRCRTASSARWNSGPRRRSVYVDVAGKLVSIDVRQAGQRVEAGQTLAQLQNIDLGLSIAKLEGS